MLFRVIPWNGNLPTSGNNEVYLRIDRWNDYSFVTMFQVYLFDEIGKLIELGSVKIGFSGQTTDTATHIALGQSFTSLPSPFFSLGTDVSYYRKLGTEVGPVVRESYCQALRDVVFDEKSFEVATGEQVFKTSLLRDSSLSAIHGQYKRVLAGGVPLTDFIFHYKIPQSHDFGGLELQVEVTANSKPRTNVHAIIGRNGVGKTTILNDMISAAIDPERARGNFMARSIFTDTPIGDDYFSSVISISFSAFDPFDPPRDRPDPESGPAYHYIGLKDTEGDAHTNLKGLPRLHGEIAGSLRKVFSETASRERWVAAIKTLESDENFAAMNLTDLLMYNGDFDQNVFRTLRRMSSGHTIAMLIMARLVETVQEKALVLIDEPESHLHPPLLSALTRSISDLLFNRNGVAIVATHSPVVLQEVPRSCVWKITRSKLAVALSRPEMETFGENVGTLTREVFGLEVSKSGFHSLLASEVNLGRSFNEVLEDYSGQLGFEAQAILQAMITQRDLKAS
jgi:predicted ATPase